MSFLLSFPFSLRFRVPSSWFVSFRKLKYLGTVMSTVCSSPWAEYLFPEFFNMANFHIPSLKQNYIQFSYILSVLFPCFLLSFPFILHIYYTSLSYSGAANGLSIISLPSTGEMVSKVGPLTTTKPRFLVSLVNTLSSSGSKKKKLV